MGAGLHKALLEAEIISFLFVVDVGALHFRAGDLVGVVAKWVLTWSFLFG